MGVQRTILAIAALLALAGCSSADTSAGVTPPSSFTSTTSAIVTSSSTGPGTAVVKAYASMVSRAGGGLVDEMKQVKESCDWLLPGQVGATPGSTRCRTAVTNVSEKAAALSTMLKDAQTPGASSYLGAPPIELRGLVDETTRMLDDLAVVAGPDTAACVSAAGPDCKSKLVVLNARMTAMTLMLDSGWPSATS